jgi:hypothetical protein
VRSRYPCDESLTNFSFAAAHPLCNPPYGGSVVNHSRCREAAFVSSIADSQRPP